MPEPASSSDPPRRSRWLPSAFLVLGLISIVLLVLSDRLRDQLVEQDSARVLTLSEIGTSLAISHLWVEEYVSGDEVPLEEVWENLESARRKAEALLAGGLRPIGDFDVEPLADPALRHRVREIAQLIAQFETISRERCEGFDRGEIDEVKIGSDKDKAYDRVFALLFSETTAFRDSLDERLKKNASRLSLLFRIILLGWIALLAGAVAALWSRERRREKAEAALSKSRVQLLQAQKMEAVGRLAGGMAHDINNYLGAMTSQCEVVRLGSEPGSTLARRMGTVIATAMKASDLIRRLLAFSRQQPTQPRVVNLNAVISDLDQMMHRLVGEDMKLELCLAEDLWNVKVDPAQIEQVVVNLLVNAREAMPVGGKVTFQTSNCLRDEQDPSGKTRAVAGEYVLLSVTDTGPGIAPEIRDKIFEPFFTTKHKTQGSGLGLATVYGIVEQHRGKIWVYSEPGEGATFKIYLPRSSEKAQEPAAEAAGRPLETARGEKILLVEDNPELRESTSAILEALGYRVGVASCATEALELFSDGWSDIDLLITDVVMPDLSGKELSDRLLAIKSDLGVLFVSGYTDHVVLRHGIAEGEVNFLEKPFAAGSLARKIRKILEKKEA